MAKKKSQPGPAGFMIPVENKAEAPKETKVRKPREPKVEAIVEPVAETQVADVVEEAPIEETSTSEESISE